MLTLFPQYFFFNRCINWIFRRVILVFWAAHQLILLSTEKRISEYESDGFWAWNLLYFSLINFFCLSELKILSRMLNRMMNKTNLYFNIDLRYFKIYNLSILASALLSYWLRFHWISFLTKSILTNSQSIRKPFSVFLHLLGSCDFPVFRMCKGARSAVHD